MGGIIFLLNILPLSAQEHAIKIRESELFNFDWKFNKDNPENAQSVDYDDSNWRKLDLPHDFQLEQNWDKKASRDRGFKAMGIGWYRKSFKANPAWKGRKVLLDFEGIMLVGDVWFNGVKVGKTDYGYLGFEVDISKYINYEGKNVVAVRADTGKPFNSRWYTGGGLYRDVHLLVKDIISVARHGVFISTSNITEHTADIHVQVEIEGMMSKKDEVDIEVKIWNPDGQMVAITQGRISKVRKKTEEISLPIIHINNPQLWSCETPHLYSAEVTLFKDGKPIDLVKENFGIRHIEFSPEFGFKLNGKKIILKGTANHQDLGALGVATYERAIEKRFELLKSYGFNHIRTSHNPYSETFLHMADKHGFLIVDELFDKLTQRFAGGRIPWMELWPIAIPEWIKRDRNHPSVIMWSLGNEYQMDDTWCGFEGDWGVTSYKILDIMIKRYDPTRKTTVAMFPARKNGIRSREKEFNHIIEPPELSVVTDIASYNYTYPAFSEYAKQYPHLIFYQSEAATRQMGKCYYGMNLDKVVGLAYWGAIEYLGESEGWPWKGWHYSFFDHSLEPYPQAYFIKSMFSEEPIVHIAVVDSDSIGVEWNDVIVGTTPMSSHWNRPPKSIHSIFTYTNAEEVELLINGKSLGVQKNDMNPLRRNAIFWRNVPYRQGKIVAIARRDGKEIARHELETTGKAVRLKMEIDNKHWKADGLDLQHIKVYATDAKGCIVRTATDEVTFDISGPADIIAVDNGDIASHEPYSGNKRTLHRGSAIAVLRAAKVGGKVRIKATSPSLKSVEQVLTLNMK
ncbi:hypothetical protein HMPREF9447_03118 [Bacteroides oleiciplenus YIT 12058]|uniref:Uncharacterized protein n=1 Tax=Bacteroides oleiciplenus YIT 12058 TaxID=742727 RepID=K9EKJ2_9BACE|nr:hypothetical protein HMPREF9447_03118 [Bacteroides oleiciplenus YIT 12058]